MLIKYNNHLLSKNKNKSLKNSFAIGKKHIISKSWNGDIYIMFFRNNNKKIFDGFFINSTTSLKFDNYSDFTYYYEKHNDLCLFYFKLYRIFLREYYSMKV